MSIIIRDASLLLGKDLTFVNSGFIEIGRDGLIKKARAGNHHNTNDGRNKEKNEDMIVDAEGFLIIPGLINAHTHVGDSIGKDIALDSGLDTRVHPVHGAKKKILQETKPEHLKIFIRSTAISMVKKGITAFADFREGGYDGVKLLKDAMHDLPIKCVILGRIEYYFDYSKKREKWSNNSRDLSKTKNQNGKRLPPEASQMAADILRISDGLGISGANENTDESLRQYYRILQKNKANNKKLLLAIHVAESKSTSQFSKLNTKRTEVKRVMQFLKPDFVVHMTNATNNDISLVAKRRTGIIVCPRANGILATGIPKVSRMLKSDCTIGIGTDNVMLNSPDIFREMDYLWKASRAIEHNFICAKDILKMATVNGAKILRLNSGYIEEGRSADLVFINKRHIDLSPMHNPYAAIVHRASKDSISAVMINGRFVNELQL
jgi:cytosine/adenosine deaminase-related metal-dependent hydrolase